MNFTEASIPESLLKNMIKYVGGRDVEFPADLVTFTEQILNG